ncbi:hypothetical protein R1flu_021190 [Riccia fluitans]|uniref:Protein PAM68, chloroplastic n=1 Tax=Riccia fluitans TaxID=41844 RepID=A0ABD1ZPT2_9MARC
MALAVSILPVSSSISGLSSQRLVQRQQKHGKVCCGGVARHCRRWGSAATRWIAPENLTRPLHLEFPLGTVLRVNISRRQRIAFEICASLQSDKKGFEEEAEDDVVPEVVTNRMLKRISLTVGVPLAVGVLFFPLYYYLKVVKKVDVPEWLPLLTSMLTFGLAGLGITYGVLSASWDPAREGSLLGWKEAQLNWPVFLETIQGKREKK